MTGSTQILWEEWQRSAAGLKDALDGISRLLGSAATQYQVSSGADRRARAASCSRRSAGTPMW